MSVVKDVVGGIGDVIGTIIGGGKDESSAPAPPPSPAPAPAVQKETPVMPTPDDAAVNKAKRQSLQKQAARRGRMSTILTSDSETLG